MSEFIDVGKLGSVLADGLGGGAGLVAVFALGLTGFSARRVSGGGNDAVSGHRPAGLALAFVCFAIVIAGVVLGLYVMLAA